MLKVLSDGVLFLLSFMQFHGGCDLVLVSSKKFLNGVGMDVHIRTK